MCGKEERGETTLDLDALHRVHEGIFLPNNLDLDVRANIHVPIVFHRLLAFVFATILKLARNPHTKAQLGGERHINLNMREVTRSFRRYR